MKVQTAKWIEQAEYDIETAEAMLRTRRYVYVVFMCHLTLEKMLKAIFTEVTEEYPPRIHNLEKIAQSANVSFPGELQGFIHDLSDMSIPTRYDEEVRDIGYAQARRTLAHTRKAFKWLRQQLK